MKKKRSILIPSTTICRKDPANLEPQDRRLFEKEISKELKSVELFEYSNCNVTPEGIVFKGFSLDEDLLIYAWQKKTYNVLYVLSSFFKRKKIKLPTEKTYLLIFDNWSNSVFHWMCDALPRLEAVKEKAKDCVLLIPENFVYPYIYDSLKAYQFKHIYKIPLNSYVHCKQLISPEQITVSGEVNPDNIRAVRKTILDHYQAKFSSKFRSANIYISRSKAQYRKVLNETEILPLLKKYDFEIIHFEDMNFTEQVECCFNARNIISIHGANLTNIAFMQPGGSVLEFRKKDDIYNNYFYSISDSMLCHYFYQHCEMVDHVPGKNFFDLIVDPGLLEKNIQQMLQKTGTH